jgi:phage gp36-like protein
MAYLTQLEYLSSFDEAETISLTDPNGVEIDDTKLNAALKDGSDIVDSYVGSRYTVPLSPIPDVIKNIVADLARERLFTLHPNDEVTKRADRARAMLKDIAKGVMVLIDGTGIVEDSASDSPAYCGPDTIFTPCVLNSYRGLMR